jgi:hypothetical protein
VRLAQFRRAQLEFKAAQVAARMERDVAQ